MQDHFSLIRLNKSNKNFQIRKIRKIITSQLLTYLLKIKITHKDGQKWEAISKDIKYNEIELNAKVSNQII